MGQILRKEVRLVRDVRTGYEHGGACVQVMRVPSTHTAQSKGVYKQIGTHAFV
jgi:hypothetical protein